MSRSCGERTLGGVLAFYLCTRAAGHRMEGATYGSKTRFLAGRFLELEKCRSCDCMGSRIEQVVVCRSREAWRSCCFMTGFWLFAVAFDTLLDLIMRMYRSRPIEKLANVLVVVNRAPEGMIKSRKVAKAGQTLLCCKSPECIATLPNLNAVIDLPLYNARQARPPRQHTNAAQLIHGT